MKKITALFMALLVCMSMCLVVSAEEAHNHVHNEALSFDALVELAAVSYPACSNCGGTSRDFHASDNCSTHIVRCANCCNQITEETCWALSEATCVAPGLCICDREVEEPTDHSKVMAPFDQYTHGEICLNEGCEYNPDSPYFIGAFETKLHVISPYDYVYDFYYHNETGERWHSKDGCCSVCQYTTHDYTICLYPYDTACNGARCFGDTPN